MKLVGSTFFLTLLLVFSLNTSRSFACGDYCDYGGAYETGGYNLYSFSIDLYTVADYGYSGYDSGYGGSCGSFSGCNSCYDVGLTSGYSGLNNYYDNSLIDWQISSLTNQLNQYIQNQNYGGYPTGGMGGGYPGGFPGYGGTNPYYPPLTNYPPTWPNTPTWPTTPYYPPAFPTVPTFPTTVPPVTTYTPVTSLPTSTPPTALPPYGGCDNIIIMCPGGPVTRPPVFTPTVTNTNTFPTQPMPPQVYQPSNTNVDSTPVRFRVPRGVRTH